ncbi:MAG: amidohydrolase family protein [Candidatus Poribacteria bacterium]|nr:amidohydrolase family protein [Candidatus Poribacteria bacterium]
MIIDCHTHLWRYPGELTEELARETFIMRKQEIDLNLTNEMHDAAVAKVDRAIVFGLRAPLTGFFTVNDTVADYVRTNPKKIIGFAAICPTEEDALTEVDRAVQELGLRGLKMSPIYGGWDPLHPRALQIYARAEELGLPIMFHQGTTFPRKAPLKYANPILLEEVALRFPNLRMIIAHIGHPWEAEAIVLIRKQPNVFADISGLFYRPWQFYNSLRLAVEYGVADKLLFGTDYPIATFDETVEGLHNVVQLSKEMRLPPLPDDLPDQILHRDTLNLLGLDDPAEA